MAKSVEPKVLCQTPAPGRKGTQIAEWKYLAVRKALLRAIPKHPKGIAFDDLPERVEKLLSPDHRARLGSVVWYTVTVKLHLEVIGEIERLPGVSPQRLRRST